MDYELQEFAIKFSMFLVAFGFVVLLFFAVKSDMKWQKWADIHCTITARDFGSVGSVSGFSSSGNVVFGSVSTPSRTTYKCDDGITYIR